MSAESHLDITANSDAFAQLLAEAKKLAGGLDEVQDSLDDLAAQGAATDEVLRGLADEFLDAGSASERLTREIEKLRENAKLSILKAESEEYAAALRDAAEASEYLAATSGGVGAVAETLSVADAAAQSLAREIASIQERARLDVLRAESEEYAAALRDASAASAYLSQTMRDASGASRDLDATTTAQVAQQLSAADTAASSLANEISALRDRARLDILRAESEEFAEALRDAEQAAEYLAAKAPRLSPLAKEITDARRASESLTREIEQLQEKARLDRLKASSKEYAAALREADKASRELGGSSGQLKANLVLVADAAMSIASRVVDAAKSFIDFAVAGADAARVAKSFQGDLGALRRSSVGLIDDTTLQKAFALGRELSLTGKEIEGLAARAADLYAQGLGDSAGENLLQLINPEIESMKNLGVVIDTTAEKYQGLTESQRAITVSREQAAIGAQALADGLSTEGLEIQAAQVAWTNFIGDMQVGAAEFLRSSGALELLSSAMQQARDWFEQNRDIVERLGGVAMQGLERGFMLLGTALRVVTPLVRLLTPAFELLADALTVTAEAIDIVVTPLGDLIGYISGGVPLTNGLAEAFDAVDAAMRKSAAGAEEMGAAVHPTKLAEIAHNAALLRDEIEHAGGNTELLGLRLASLAKDPQDAVNTLLRRELDLRAELEKQAPAVDELETRWKSLSAAFEQTKWMHGENDPRAIILKQQLDAATAAWVQADEALNPLRNELRDVEAAHAAVAKATKETTKAKRQQIDTIGLLRRGWVELYVVMGGDAAETETVDFNFRIQSVSQSLEQQRQAVDYLRGSYSALSESSGEIFGTLRNAFIGEYDAWGGMGGMLGQLTGGTAEDEFAAKVSMLSETITAKSEALGIWRDALSESDSAFASFAGGFEGYADTMGGALLRMTTSFLSASQAWYKHADALGAAFTTLETGMGSQRLAYASIASAAIDASGSLALGFIDNERTKAGVLAAMETAHAIAAAASFNWVGAAAHTAAAVQYGLVAGGALGSARSGGSGRAAAPPGRASAGAPFGTALSESPDPARQPPQTTTTQIFITTFDDPRAVAERMASVLNGSIETGGGVRLSTSLMADMGRSGL